MSSASTSSYPMQIEKEAADWIADQDREDWDDTDQERLDAWLAESPAHEIAYWRLDLAWAGTARLAALRRPSQPPSSDAPRRSILTRIAAVFGLVIATGLFFSGSLNVPRPPAREQTFATDVGGHEVVTLTDGSQIELNTDTVVRVALDDRSRTVMLDRGEAYFQIVHNTAHPFVVIAGRHRVTDIGTRFVMRREAEHLQLTLVQGSARFESLDNSARSSSLELSPGDNVVATPNGVTLTKKQTAAVSKELGWRHGVVVFDSTTLADAAAEFNRYSKIKIVIADPVLAQRTIDGTFQINNIEAFADTTQAALKLKVRNRQSEIVISR